MTVYFEIQPPVNRETAFGNDGIRFKLGRWQIGFVNKGRVNGNGIVGRNAAIKQKTTWLISIGLCNVVHAKYLF